MRGEAWTCAGVVGVIAGVLFACSQSGTVVPPPGAIDDATVPPFADVGVDPEASGPVADGGAANGVNPEASSPVADGAADVLENPEASRTLADGALDGG